MDEQKKRKHYQAVNKHIASAYDQVKFIVRKEENLPALIDEASKAAGQGKQAYIIDAVKARLKEDGIIE